MFKPLVRAFGKRAAPPAPPATPPERPQHGPAYPILVRRSKYDAERPEDLVFEVGSFFNFAVDKAKFEREELSPNALRSHYVTQYEGEVKNGGHGQYAGNRGHDSQQVASVQAGLDEIGHPIAAVLLQFLDLARRDPVRGREIARRRGFGAVDPAVKQMDSEFYRLDREQPLMAAHRAWLKTLPELTIVDDTAYQPALDALKAANPDGPKREAERKKAAEEADLRNPIKVALGYLCAMADQRFFDWHSGRPGRDIGDGPNAISFALVTDKGDHVAFVHPKVCLLFNARDMNTPVATVPSEMVLSYVRDKAGQDLLAHLNSDIDLR